MSSSWNEELFFFSHRTQSLLTKTWDEKKRRVENGNLLLFYLRSDQRMFHIFFSSSSSPVVVVVVFPVKNFLSFMKKIRKEKKKKLKKCLKTLKNMFFLSSRCFSFLDPFFHTIVFVSTFIDANVDKFHMKCRKKIENRRRERGEKRLNHAFVSKNFSMFILFFCYFIKCLYAWCFEEEFIASTLQSSSVKLSLMTKIFQAKLNTLSLSTTCIFVYDIIRLSAQLNSKYKRRKIVHCGIFCSTFH